MKAALSETQHEVADLARELFARRVTPERVEKAEADTDRFDRELWTALAESGLLGVGVDEQHGGLGFGAVETMLVLEQLGRCVAPVPLAPTLVAAAILRAGGGDLAARWLPPVAAGAAVCALALPPSTGGVRVTAGRATGEAVAVPWAHVADRVLLICADAVVLLDPATVATRRDETTAREVALTMTLDDTPVEVVGVDPRVALQHARTAYAAVCAGVTDAAVRMTAAYTSEREQFGKPLSTFQGVALKAADAYLDATAIRAVALRAAWTLDQPAADATLPALTAAWWAAEAGQHCVHLTQHLHGGMGADVTYPVHRYFLWGKQIELLLGGASALLAELGDELRGRPDAGEALVL